MRNIGEIRLQNKDILGIKREEIVATGSEDKERLQQDIISEEKIM